MRCMWLGWAVGFTLIGPATDAWAAGRDPAAAEVLFQEGRDAVQRGNWPLACSKFRESERLDPGVGTLMNLADCEEKIGRLASAWERWREDVEREGMRFAAAPEYQVFPTRERPLKPYEAAVLAAQETRELVREFSELLDAVTESVEDDPGIDANEAEQIRQKWEDLKACTEKFVAACEKGHYVLKRK